MTIAFLGRRTVVLIVLAVLSTAAYGTTWRPVTLTCPFDQAEVRTHVLMSVYIAGMTADLQPLGPHGPTDSLVMCPTCGFVAQADELEDAGELDPALVRDRLGRVETSPLFRKLDAAAQIEAIWKNRPELLASYAMAAKWLADETGEPAVIDARRAAAIVALVRQHDAAPADDPDRGYVTYLLGELHRQQGDLDAAFVWFDKARAILPENERFLLDAQVFRATVHAKSWREVLAAAQTAPPGGRVAAVELLRDVDDAEVMRFIEDVALRSPEDVREAAMDAVLGRQRREAAPVPPRRFLPLFLRAIRSDHYRTVQGGAYGIELLRAREAAPALLEVLRAPVDATESRLGSALAAVATAEQVEALQQSPLEPHELFRALVNTRTPVAAPAIVALAREEPHLVPFYDGEEGTEVRRSLPAIAGALLALLPDPITAEQEDSLAMLAVEVLASLNTPEARETLVAVLPRRDDLAELAALRLLEQGDARGKAILVSRIPSLLLRDETSDKLLYAVLEPTDFPSLLDQLEAERASKREEVEYLRQQIAEAPNEGFRRSLQDRLDEVFPDTQWWMQDWLPFLGATRYPDAAPILMEYLGHENLQARRGAVVGLGLLGDRAHLKELTERLPHEEPDVQDAIVEALGRIGDPAAAGAVAALADQPTPVFTKLSMMATLRLLDPAAGRPLVERWAQSPHRGLAEAARAALVTWPR